MRSVLGEKRKIIIIIKPKMDFNDLTLNIIKFKYNIVMMTQQIFSQGIEMKRRDDEA